LDQLSAHQLSVVSGILFFAIYVWIISGKWRMTSKKQAITIGLMWLFMTIIFEFIFGHYVMGHAWEMLFNDYNIFEGRLWMIVLVWITLSPYIFYNIRKKRNDIVIITFSFYKRFCSLILK
ncbi:MAG: hypothetical protein GYA14_05405, partial [Ignavibacteria bacterium]|nr:hypothetical protein [Ignavibacteria bacterium]